MLVACCHRVVKCCTCRVVAFEAVLCGDVWDIVGNVW